jgi:hypothetical protein
MLNSYSADRNREGYLEDLLNIENLRHFLFSIQHNIQLNRKKKCDTCSIQLKSSSAVDSVMGD